MTTYTVVTSDNNHRHHTHVETESVDDARTLGIRDALQHGVGIGDCSVDVYAGRVSTAQGATRLSRRCGRIDIRSCRI